MSTKMDRLSGWTRPKNTSQRAMRRCLRGGEMFMSDGPGNRICKRHRQTTETINPLFESFPPSPENISGKKKAGAPKRSQSLREKDKSRFIRKARRQV